MLRQTNETEDSEEEQIYLSKVQKQNEENQLANKRLKEVEEL
jgi:hypothetical protein